MQRGGFILMTKQTRIRKEKMFRIYIIKYNIIRKEKSITYTVYNKTNIDLSIQFVNATYECMPIKQ